MKVHLVDGTFELYRHFLSPYARATQRPDGVEAGAALAVVRSCVVSLFTDLACHALAWQ